MQIDTGVRSNLAKRGNQEEGIVIHFFRVTEPDYRHGLWRRESYERVIDPTKWGKHRRDSLGVSKAANLHPVSRNPGSYRRP